MKNKYWNTPQIHTQLQSSKNIVWIELGVHLGTNAAYIFEHYDVVKMYLIDPYCVLPYHTFFDSQQKVDKNKAIAHAALQANADKCQWLEDYAANVANTIPAKSVDVLFIDGNHSEESVLQDLTLYVPAVREGGLVICDDFNETSVKSAINLFCKYHKIGYTVSDYRTSRKQPLQIAWWHHV